MTKFLNGVIEHLPAMADEQQNASALTMSEDMEDERRWDESFGRSQQTLARLAEDALAEVAEEGSLPFDPGSQPG